MRNLRRQNEEEKQKKNIMQVQLNRVGKGQTEGEEIREIEEPT